MSNSKWSFLHDDIEHLYSKGMSPLRISEVLLKNHKGRPELKGLTAEDLRNNAVKGWVGKIRDLQQYNTEAIETNKKVSEFHWRSILEPMQAMQKSAKDASNNQDYATWKIKTDEPICVLVLGDTQLGSWATDYELFKQVTDQIINTPNLYVILVGDLLQMAIKLRGVLEVSDNLLPPKFQMMFLESWLGDIKHKVIAATWDNHSVMREEDATGVSRYAEILSRHAIYFNHIGNLDIQVGDITYRWVVSHFFQGKSEGNPCYAPMKYLRFKGQDRDVAFQGDYHVPGIIKYIEGGKERVAGVCGSIQTESGYSKRFFDLLTAPVYPCVVLDPHEKIMTPLWSVQEWLNLKQSK